MKMSFFKKNSALSALLMFTMVAGVVSLPALGQAQDYERVYNAKAHRYVYVPKQSVGSKISGGIKDAWRNPTVKKGAIGAGIGLGAAALSDRSLMKGSLVGAGVGAGVGMMDNSRYFREHPLMKTAGKGALLGGGVSSVTGISGVLPAAAIGAGIGTGVHYIKK
jgi:hypothetical protein